MSYTCRMLQATPAILLGPCCAPPGCSSMCVCVICACGGTSSDDRLHPNRACRLSGVPPFSSRPLSVSGRVLRAPHASPIFECWLQPAGGKWAWSCDQVKCQKSASGRGPTNAPAAAPPQPRCGKHPNSASLQPKSHSPRSVHVPRHHNERGVRADLQSASQRSRSFAYSRWSSTVCCRYTKSISGVFH